MRMTYRQCCVNGGRLILIGIIFAFVGCQNQNTVEVIQDIVSETTIDTTRSHLIVLGIAQDAGYPQANCKKSCCTEVWKDKNVRKMVSCLGVRDPKTKKAWMIDATPDFKDQLKILLQGGYSLEGVFLTHAHMGHYTGLMHLGREAMGADSIPVYVMPRMKKYLESNGPWSQLVSLNNITLKDLQNYKEVNLSSGLSLRPFLVPHRDEFSETVGYELISEKKEIIFIPDIDKWEKWDKDINLAIKQSDLAFLDGSFFRNGEIWGRDMSQIPHPFIEESISQFLSLSDADKKKVHFIHLNHTNPLLNKASTEYKTFVKGPYKLAIENQKIEL